MKNNGKDILVSAAALTIIGGVVTAPWRAPIC